MGEPVFSISFSPESMGKLRYLQNHVLTLPNKIHNIKVSSSHLAARKLKTYLRNTYKTAGRGMTVKIVAGRGIQKGRLLLSVSAARALIPKNTEVKGTQRENLSANILLFGRKAYTSRASREAGPYKLREASVGKYPEYIYSFRVKRKSRSYAARADIKKEASKLLREAIYARAIAEGFGVRGGNPSRMQDTPYVNQKDAPNERVGW